jgi:DNA repair protein RadD
VWRGGRHAVDNHMMLRPYQVAALEGLRQGIRDGHRRQLLVSPTGSGKTQIASAMIRGAVAKGHRVMVIAHRRELIYQVQNRLWHDHELISGVIMAGHAPEPGLPIQVASIQSLVRREFPDVELLIVDEAHHARATTYHKVFDRYPSAWIVGLSATPWRLDGKGLIDVFDHMVLASTPQKLLELGFLCPGFGHAYVSPDLAKIGMIGSDYNPEELGQAYEASGVLGDIVAEWQKEANGLRTIIFASSISNSEWLVARFLELGVKAEHLDYLTPRKTREAIIQRVRSGETTVISNVGILGEGVDIPELECCILARPTKSLSFFLQMVGRVLRPAGGKTRALIHDHGHLLETHGLWDQERDYSLTVTKKKQPGAAPTKTCPECGCICPLAARECPECHHVFEKKDDENDGEHVKLTIEEMRAILEKTNSREALFARYMQEAKLWGRKPGWVINRIQEKLPGSPFPSALWKQHVVGMKGDWKWRE